MTQHAEIIVQTLRAHQAEFEAMGVKHLALFGSYSTGDEAAASDIDIGVAFDEAVKHRSCPAAGCH